jgi:DNA repair protein RadC
VAVPIAHHETLTARHDELNELNELDAIARLLRRILGPQCSPHELLRRAGGIEGLARASVFELAAHLEERDLDPLNPLALRRSPRPHTLRRAESLAAAFELGRSAALANARPRAPVTSSDCVAAWAIPRLSALSHEELWLLALDARSQLRAARCIAKGGLQGAAVRAADPIRVALRCDATAFVLVHNHPSGDPTPSMEDIALTTHVANASRVAGVPLVDHVVVGAGHHACVPFETEEQPPRHASRSRRG